MNSIRGLQLVLLTCGIQILYTPSSLSAVTIGLNQAEVTVSEQNGPVSLCVEVIGSSDSDYHIYVNITYQDRSAVEGSDFEGTYHRFLFTPAAMTHCFNVTLVDDQVYELRKEFFVNITTRDTSATLAPHFTVIRVDDDDGVRIGWEHESYTVGEEDGQLEVCVRFYGTLGSTTLPQSRFEIQDETAKSSIDFRYNSQGSSDFFSLNFQEGSNSSSKICRVIDILKNIEYEGEKNFTLVITPQNNVERLTIDPSRTTIIIRDHNVITVQQPSSACEGLKNLINSSSGAGVCAIEDTTNAELCDTVICSFSNQSLFLSLQACNREIILNVTDDADDVIASAIFPSEEEFQYLNHTIGNQTKRTRLISRVVSSEENLYYLVSLDSPLLNISFEMTAIPLVCSLSGSIETPTTTTTGTSHSSSRVRDIIIIACSAGGGVIIIILIIAVVILTVVCVLVSKRRGKKTLLTPNYW